MKHRILPVVTAALSAWVLSSSAEAQERLPSLRATFEDALVRIEGGYQQLNDSYFNALARQMESESSAGKLENALAIKAEIEAFKGKAVFDKAAFEKRLSPVASLKRLQNTYLAQRNALSRDLEPQRKDVVTKYDKELGNVQLELTKIGQLTAAVTAKTAQEQLRADPRFVTFFNRSGAAPQAIQGKIRFVTKGEMELYLNGKPFSYRNEYEGPNAENRITGETKGSEVFHIGDVLVIRSRSPATYRGIIMAVISDNDALCIPIRVEHLRFLGVEKGASSLTADKVKSTAPGVASQGGNDQYMTPEWDRIKGPAANGNDSQWLRAETANEWHSWGVIFTPEMIVAPNEE